jgi:SAM-dependent MidA family methyltransferase
MQTRLPAATQTTRHEEFPEPDPTAQTHSGKLADRIRDEIERHQGSIDFRRYMEMALYEPGLGYYSAGARKFGKAGDFITAPEISALFSSCLAVQCEEVLQTLQGGVILELGAGTGTMACDLLDELQRRNSLPDKYLILETSADLKQRQCANLARRIPHLLHRITWLDRLPSSPVTGLIIANEVLDAQPVQRLYKSDNRIFECGVAWDGYEFNWIARDAPPELALAAGQIQAKLAVDWPEAYTTEVNPQLTAWIGSLGDILQQGVMLFLDYGYPQHEYYHPQRSAGTLLCHYRHRVHDDPFFYPGLQDITASVDFTVVAEAAVQSGLSVQGFTGQMYFLMSCELESMMNNIAGQDPVTRHELARQVKLLTMPGEMGERFKVMALGRNYLQGLRGFALADQRKHL